MSKKGFSRKGERRRKTAEKTTPTMDPMPIAAEDPAPLDTPPSAPKTIVAREFSAQATKLDVEDNATFDRIARIAPVFVPATDIAPKIAREDDTEWMNKKAKIQNHRWLWIGVGSFLLFMIAMIVLFQFVSKNHTGSTNPLATLEVISEEYDPLSPLYIFQQDPGKAQQQCIEILRRYAAAKTLEEAQLLVRRSPEINASMKSSWKPWPIPPLLDDGTCQGSFDETSGRAYFILSGLLKNDQKFTAYFVSQGNQLVLDWEATTGRSDMSLTDFLKHPPEQAATMRLVLTPSPYYMPELGENEYESYRLQDIQNDTYAWGYVARNSPAHQLIQSMLQSGSVLLEQLPESQATVKLQKMNDPIRKNQFFITDVLHKGWVMP